MKLDDYGIYYSCGSKHVRGVGLLLSQQLLKYVIGWGSVNDSIMTVILNTWHSKCTLVQVYAPTNGEEDKDKDDQLQDAVSAIPKHDLVVVMGDFNAVIGHEKVGFEDVMEMEAVGQRTDNGERLLSFCNVNGLKVGGSLFRHKSIHKGTWRSPDGLTVHKIDHICVSRRWASSLQDVCVSRGADVSSDHYLLISKFRLKLKTLKKNEASRSIVVRKLQHLEVISAEKVLDGAF